MSEVSHPTSKTIIEGHNEKLCADCMRTLYDEEAWALRQQVERLTRELETSRSIARGAAEHHQDACLTCDRLRAALEKAADTFADFNKGLRLLNRPLLADACEVAEKASREALSEASSSAVETGTEPEPVAFVGYVNEQPDIIYPGTTRLEGRRYLPIWRPEDHPCARRDAQKTPETADDPLEHSKVILDEILAERERQVTRLGWTPQHDDEHDDRALARAAATYVLHYTHRAVFAKSDPSAYQEEAGAMDAACWPDGWEFKPKAPHWDLIRAAALIVAELERLDRSSPQKAAAEPSQPYQRKCIHCGKMGPSATPEGVGVYYCSIECAD